MANSEDTPITSNYVTVSGRVTPTDGIYREKIPVKISQEEGMEETLYTDSEGYYEGTILLGSSNDIIAKVGNDKAIWKLIDGIVLSSDKQIISYNGGNNPECATITAQLTKNNSNVNISGENITFEIRKKSDDSLVETLTATTDSSGIATVSYYGKGTGDLYIKCFSSNPIIVTENYIIEDCKKAFKLDGTEPTGNFSRGSITCSGGILSGKSGYVKGFDNTNEWILSFDVYHINYTIVPIVATTTTNYNGNYVQILGSYVRVITNGNFTDYPFDSGATKKYNEWQNIKIIKENGQYTLYFDDVFAATFTTPWNPTQLGVGFDAWNGSNSGQIKNIKVKPL